jgi:hypothetical protein
MKFHCRMAVLTVICAGLFLAGCGGGASKTTTNPATG